MDACFHNSSGEFTTGFESDSQVLVEAIHKKRRDNSEFLSFVNDINYIYYVIMCKL
jgi:hypothetical protein